MNRQSSTSGGDSREKVGRLTSANTFCRRSSGATRYRGDVEVGLHRDQVGHAQPSRREALIPLHNLAGNYT